MYSMGLFSMADEKLIVNFSTNIRKGGADVFKWVALKNVQYSMLNFQYSVEMQFMLLFGCFRKRSLNKNTLVFY